MTSPDLRDESGQVLMIALGFLVVVGVTVAALVGLVTTNLGTKNQLRSQRGNAYAVEAAAQSAMGKIRPTTNCPAAPTVVNLDPVFVYDGASIQASYTCTATTAGIITNRAITLMACRIPSPSGPCTPATQLLTSTVHIMDLPGNVGAISTVGSWNARY